MKRILIILAVICMSACEVDVLQEPAGRRLTLHASFADAGKTAVVDGGTKVFWEPGDEIKVFSINGSARFTTSIGGLQATADFSGCLDYVDGWPLLAIYPWSAQTDLVGDSSIAVTMPEFQTARAGTFAQGANLAMSYTTGTSLHFRNINGGVRFTLSRDDVSKVVMEGADGEVLAGTVAMDFENIDQLPTVGDKIAGRTRVTLAAPEGSTLEAGKWYYISTLPVTLSKGVKLTLHTADGKQSTLESAKPLTIECGFYAGKPQIDAPLDTWTESDPSAEEPDLSVGTVRIEIPADSDSDYVSGFVLCNAYGTFPLTLRASSSGAMTKAGFSAPQLVTDYKFNPGGDMLQFIRNANEDAQMICITSPGKADGVSIDAGKVFESLLRIHPLLITEDDGQWADTYRALTKLDAFADLYGQFYVRYADGLKKHYCPDYSDLNYGPLINELLANVKGDTELYKDGISIRGIRREGGKYSFTLRNDRKRVLHVYGRRARMYDNNLVVKEVEPIGLTIGEMIEQALGLSAVPDNYLFHQMDSDMLDAEQEFREMAEEMPELKNDPFLKTFEFPMICESGKSDYLSIVGAVVLPVWNPLDWDYDSLHSSVFESEHDLSFNVGDFDKLYVDVYGIGIPHASLYDLSEREIIRLAAVLVHGGYNDYVKPLIELASGVKKEVKVARHNYSFKYVKDEAPFCTMMAILAKNWCKNGQNLQKFVHALDDGELKDVLSAVETLGTFVFKQFCKNSDPKEQDLLWSLAFRCFKNEFGNGSVAFKQKLTRSLGHLSLILQTMDVSEAIMDTGESVWTTVHSCTKNTFIVDDADSPYIDVSSPLGIDALSGNEIRFEWDVCRGRHIGYLTYDIALQIMGPDMVECVGKSEGIVGTEYKVSKSALPDLKTAVYAKYEIIARDAVTGNVVARTGLRDLYEETKGLEDVPGFDL